MSAAGVPFVTVMAHKPAIAFARNKIVTRQ
jgi:hypothetical protein